MENFSFNYSAPEPEETVYETVEAVEEPVVEEAPAVEEKPVVVEKPKAKSKGKGKVVYATKRVVIGSLEIPQGYSKIEGELNLEIALAHPKVRIASEYEVETYFEGAK